MLPWIVIQPFVLVSFFHSACLNYWFLIFANCFIVQILIQIPRSVGPGITWLLITRYSTRLCFMRPPYGQNRQHNLDAECIILVDGTWSEWTSWSLCSKTCGHQEEFRTRVCENQRCGGSYCSGHDIEVMPCNDYDYNQCPGKSLLDAGTEI